MKGVIILFSVVLGILLIDIIRNALFKRKGQHHSNWSTIVPSFNYSSKEFYKQLQEVIAQNKEENINCKVVEGKEGNALSHSRNYLRIRWKEYNYYVCVASYGDGLFLSWWLFKKQRKREIIVNLIPVFGAWLLEKLYPVTMYRIDTASMYMSYCHNAMKQVLKEITEKTGFRLSENESKPVVKDYFKR